MKKSIIFKAISFIFIPIMIILVVLSIFAVYVKNGTNYNENKYYASHSFVTSYIQDLSDVCDDLIYKNENYFVATKLDSNEELTDEVRVLHEIKSNDTYVEDVKDLDLFDLIIKYVGLEIKQD